MSRVAVLTDHTGNDLVIRSDPSIDEVLTFIKGQNDRFHNHLPGGNSGQVAVLIEEAYFWRSEEEYRGWKYSDSSEPFIDSRKKIDLTSVFPPKEESAKDKD